MYPCVPGKAGEAHLGHLDLTGYRYGFRQVRGPRRAMGRSQYGFYKTTSLPNAQEGGPPFSNEAFPNAHVFVHAHLHRNLNNMDSEECLFFDYNRASF